MLARRLFSRMNQQMRSNTCMLVATPCSGQDNRVEHDVASDNTAVLYYMSISNSGSSPWPAAGCSFFGCTGAWGGREAAVTGTCPCCTTWPWCFPGLTPFFAIWLAGRVHVTPGICGRPTGGLLAIGELRHSSRNARSYTRRVPPGVVENNVPPGVELRSEGICAASFSTTRRIWIFFAFVGLLVEWHAADILDHFQRAISLFSDPV